MDTHEGHIIDYSPTQTSKATWHWCHVLCRVNPNIRILLRQSILEICSHNSQLYKMDLPNVQKSLWVWKSEKLRSCANNVCTPPCTGLRTWGTWFVRLCHRVLFLFPSSYFIARPKKHPLTTLGQRQGLKSSTTVKFPRIWNQQC